MDLLGRYLETYILNLRKLAQSTGDLDMPNLKQTSIQDCEEALEETLTTLQRLDLPQLRSLPGLDFIVPKGFRPIVELYENDRKKRRTASAETWSPETGEVRICFERVEASEDAKSNPLSDSSLLQELLN